MTKRFPASVLSATPIIPTTSTAVGVWTKEQQLQAQNQTIWPINPGLADPYFPYVTALLHGDGTNGAQNNTFLNTPPGGVGSYTGSFNGSTQSLSVSSSTAFAFGTGDFTVEAWVYLLAYGSSVVGPSIFGTAGGSATGYSLNIGQSQDAFRIISNASGGWADNLTVSAGGGPALNTWTHIAWVRQGNSMTIYKNGVSVASMTGVSAYNFTSPNNAGYVGYFSDGTYTRFLNGYISNLRVVKGTAVYTSNFTPPTAPLTAITNTQLLTCQNATFVDNSPNAFAITNNGTATIVNPNTLPTITRNGNTTQGSFAPFGTLWSNYFDGSGDYLDAGLGATTLSAAWTIECWYYCTSASGGPVILDCRPTGGNGFYPLFYVPAATQIGFFYNNTAYTYTVSNSTDRWNHIAAVKNSGTITIYFNGVSVGSFADANSSLIAAGRPRIAASGYQSNLLNFPGFVSNVRVVNGTAVYTSNFTPSSTPLTAITNTSLLTCQSSGFVDKSPNNFTITRNGDTAVSRFSPFSPTTPYNSSVIGGSGYFDGSGDYLTVPDSTSLQFGTGNFTIECWVYEPAQTGVHNTVVGKWGAGFSTTGDWSLRTRFNSVTQFAMTLKSAAGYYDITTGVNVSDSSWHHLAVVRDSTTTIKLYVDGVLKTTQTISASDIVGSTATMSIGGPAVSLGNEGASVGYISNVRLVKGTAVYTSNFTPPTAPLTAITNTSLLLSMTNGAIFDNAMMLDYETVGDAKISTSVFKYGTGSIAFDGTGDYLSTPANPVFAFGTGDFTVEAWVYPTSIATDWFICSGIGSGGFFFGNSAGIGFGWGRNAVAWDYRSGFLSVNTWSHVAVSRTGTTMRLFINGVLQGTAQTNSTSYDLSTGGTSIGSQGANYYLNGYIDDFRVTKGVGRYTANFTPPVAAFSNQ